jgi:hypothetical protein
MAKSKISRVWNNVKNFFGTCIDWCWWAIKGLAWLIWEVMKIIFIGIVVVVGIGLIYIPFTVALCWNPIMFPIWMLLSPSRTADGFYEYNRGKEACFGWFGKFIHAMLFWEVKLMPWYVRRAFIEEKPADFSVKEMHKFFVELPQDEKKGFFMEVADADRPEIIREMWDMCSEDEKKVLLTAKVESLLSSNKHCCMALRDDDVKYMLNHNMQNVMAKYIKYRTPSASTFQVLMDRVKDANSDIDCESWVVELIVAHGLSSELISWVYSCGSDKLKNLVENALRIHGQKDITKRLVGFYRGTDADEWQAFLEKTPEICAEAQMEMDYALMVKMFYEAGHHMDERAIFHWLSKGKFINEIFTNEPENGLISPRIKALVSGSETLSRTRIYIQQRKA